MCGCGCRKIKNNQSSWHSSSLLSSSVTVLLLMNEHLLRCLCFSLSHVCVSSLSNVCMRKSCLHQLLSETFFCVTGHVHFCARFSSITCFAPSSTTLSFLVRLSLSFANCIRVKRRQEKRREAKKVEAREKSLLLLFCSHRH